MMENQTLNHSSCQLIPVHVFYWRFEMCLLTQVMDDSFVALRKRYAKANAEDNAPRYPSNPVCPFA